MSCDWLPLQGLVNHFLYSPESGMEGHGRKGEIMGTFMEGSLQLLGEGTWGVRLPPPWPQLQVGAKIKRFNSSLSRWHLTGEKNWQHILGQSNCSMKCRERGKKWTNGLLPTQPPPPPSPSCKGGPGYPHPVRIRTLRLAKIFCNIATIINDH